MHSVYPHITFLTNKASPTALLAICICIESRECYQHHYPRLIWGWRIHCCNQFDDLLILVWYVCPVIKRWLDSGGATADSGWILDTAPRSGADTVRILDTGPRSGVDTGRILDTGVLEYPALRANASVAAVAA